jgi:peptidyl-prolyl cis-trans isomerase B (cyclophilin B)
MTDDPATDHHTPPQPGPRVIERRRAIAARSVSGLAATLALVPVLAGLPALARAATVEPIASFAGVNRPIPARVVGAPGDRAALALVDPARGEVLARSEPVELGPSGAETVDLARLFPLLWTTRRPGTLVLQPTRAGRAEGTPLVLEAMIEPARARDALTDAVMDAFERRDALELTRLLQLTDDEKQRLRRGVVIDEDAPATASGYRLYPLKRVALHTAEGTIEIDLAPWAAPGACRRFVELAEGGFYDDLSFHRVVPHDDRGWPFIVQAGDPTGSGLGGCGAWIDFEPGSLRHERGTVSMARRPTDPNSNGSQFIICLSREGCAGLDGENVAFGRVSGGMGVVDRIAEAPAAPSEEPGGRDIPLRPVVIQHATASPAPPLELPLAPDDQPD